MRRASGTVWHSTYGIEHDPDEPVDRGLGRERTGRRAAVLR